jgi:hypothetical protein
VISTLELLGWRLATSTPITVEALRLNTGSANGRFPFGNYILGRTSRNSRLRNPEPAEDSEFKSRNLRAFGLWIRQETQSRKRVNQKLDAQRKRSCFGCGRR